MSNNKIEKDGITCLRNFLSESKIIDHHINEEDKEPSWDGALIIYEAPGHKNRKNQIKGKIPVQVKSAKRKNNNRESFPIEKVDLTNYMNDGGIIFLRPIFTSTIDYSIFVKILLPLTIKELLKDNKNKKKTITINLEKLENVKEFEIICNHFLHNQPIQRNLSNIINIESLMSRNVEFIVKTLYKDNLHDAIFSDYCYVYCTTEDKITIPCDLKFYSLEFPRQASVSIDGQVYFENVTIKQDRDNPSFIVGLNPALNLSINNRELNFTILNSDKFLFTDVLTAFRFIIKLSTNDTFVINNNPVYYDSPPKNESFERTARFWEDTFSILKIFRVDYKNITVADLKENEKFLKYLILTFTVNNQTKFKNEEKQFLKLGNLINKSVIILYVQENETHYKAYNFIEDNPFDADYMLKRGEDIFRCSRFIGLGTTAAIRSIEGYFKEVTDDLLKYYSEDIYEGYQWFMLNCIKCYDETNNDEYLELATTLNNLFKTNKSQDNNTHNVYVVNRLQIIKRKRCLVNEENQELLNIKVNNLGNKQLIACINILLESYNEFEILFDQMDETGRNNFRDWPIWNLYYKNRSAFCTF